MKSKPPTLIRDELERLKNFSKKNNTTLNGSYNRADDLDNPVKNLTKFIQNDVWTSTTPTKTSKSRIRAY